MTNCPTCNCDMLDEYAGQCPWCSAIVVPGGQVFLVGVLREAAPWEVVGVFTDRLNAESNCRNGNHFVFPTTLNMAEHRDAVPMLSAYFPRQGATE